MRLMKCSGVDMVVMVVMGTVPVTTRNTGCQRDSPRGNRGREERPEAEAGSGREQT